MTTNVVATTTAKAPKHAVWEILADFSNIADYTDQVKTSVSTSEQPSGVGASRHCDLAPMGKTEEKILEFVPEDRMVVSLYDTKGIPVKGSKTTFSLKAVDENTTEITFSAEVEAKGGPLAGFVGKRLASRLPKGAQGLVEDLAASAEAAVSKSGNRN